MVVGVGREAWLGWARRDARRDAWWVRALVGEW